MPGPVVELRGAENLARTMHAAARRLEHMGPTMARVGGLVAGAARPPMRSGRLAGSMFARSDDRAAFIGSNVAYAGVIEYGWARRGIAPSGFLGNAGRQAEPAWVGTIAGEVDAALGTIRGV